jgi:DNA-binding transcriptional LysR family regulator
MYEGPEFRHLVSFVAVAEECSFGRAAERINLAQPSLSSQIKQVEDGLGANLFIRSQTGTSLTAPGRQFLVFARLMLQMRDHAVRATTSDKSGTDWPLRFGYTFAHGEPGAKKTLAGVAAGTGIAIMATNILTWLWGS